MTTPPPPPPPPPTSGVPATTFSCDGFPTTVPVTVNGATQFFTKVCLILQETAQVTPALNVTSNAGNLLAHGETDDTSSAFTVYARVVVTAADEGTATALAKSVVINTANGSVSSTPNQLTAPQFLEVDFEVFTQPTTNLTLTSTLGNQAVDNYSSTLQLLPTQGNVALTKLQGLGQVTITAGMGNIDIGLLGTSWTGAGLSATTNLGNISLTRPAGYQAAFTAKTAIGAAAIDAKQALAVAGSPPAVVTAGAGAPVTIESKKGNVSVSVPL